MTSKRLPEVKCPEYYEDCRNPSSFKVLNGRQKTPNKASLDAALSPSTCWCDSGQAHDKKRHFELKLPIYTKPWHSALAGSPAPVHTCKLKTSVGPSIGRPAQQRAAVPKTEDIMIGRRMQNLGLCRLGKIGAALKQRPKRPHMLVVFT